MVGWWSGAVGGRARKVGRAAGRDGEPPPRGAPWDRFVAAKEQICARSSPRTESFRGYAMLDTCCRYQEKVVGAKIKKRSFLIQESLP